MSEKAPSMEKPGNGEFTNISTDGLKEQIPVGSDSFHTPQGSLIRDELSRRRKIREQRAGSRSSASNLRYKRDKLSDLKTGEKEKSHIERSQRNMEVAAKLADAALTKTGVQVIGTEPRFTHPNTYVQAEIREDHDRGGVYGFDRAMVRGATVSTERVANPDGTVYILRRNMKGQPVYETVIGSPQAADIVARRVSDEVTRAAVEQLNSGLPPTSDHLLQQPNSK